VARAGRVRRALRAVALGGGRVVAGSTVGRAGWDRRRHWCLWGRSGSSGGEGSGAGAIAAALVDWRGGLDLGVPWPVGRWIADQHL
jgi:hypothetical protein